LFQYKRNGKYKIGIRRWYLCIFT